MNGHHLGRHFRGKIGALKRVLEVGWWEKVATNANLLTHLTVSTAGIDTLTSQ